MGYARMEKSITEQRRLSAVTRLGLLDTPPEECFDRITRIAKRFYGVPIALFTLIDENRQWFKSKQGLAISETPRDLAFCSHTIEHESVFVIEDASTHPDFADNPLVTGEPYIRFYAGIPIRDPGGFNIGSLCIIDQVPQSVPEFELDILRSLATIIEEEVERALLRVHDQEYVSISRLTRAIHRAQNTFLSHHDETAAFDMMLEDYLALTDSQFGLIGEVQYAADETPYLKVNAITNIAWNSETAGLYQEVNRRGMLFKNLNNLLGTALVSGERIISNEYATDQRRGGLPDGHPSITTYMGIPVYSQEKLIGLVGLANRLGGYSEKLADELEPLQQTVAQLIERKKFYKEKTEYKKAVEWAAHHDELTGLPNRLKLTGFLESQIREVGNHLEAVSVCFLDLDGFKEINDSLGHSVGDSVLKIVAERLRNSIREFDMIGRLGGDEFVAVLMGMVDHSVYQRMLDAVCQPVVYQNSSLSLSVSIGVTVYPSDRAEPEVLIRHADRAMYAAKNAGKNQFHIFNPDVHG